MFFTGSTYDGCTLTYINNEGVETDRIEDIPLPTGYNAQSIGKLFQFSNESGVNCYINEISDLFQTDNPLVDTGTTSSYVTQPQFKSDFISTGVIVNYETNTNECNVLTPTGYTDTFMLPENNGDWNIVVGNDKFMFTFEDLISGNTNIHLYDFDGNLLNGLLTEHTSFSNSDACGNGFVQRINENGNFYVYLVSETEISPSIITNDNSYDTFNDIVWWD